MIKRIISIILVLVMCLSLFSTSLASSSGKNSGDFLFSRGNESDTPKTPDAPTEDECKHDGEWSVVSDTATCGKDGIKTLVCAQCGKETKEEFSKATGEHTYEWKYDETGHWQVCTVCLEVKEDSKAAHTASNWDRDESNHWKTCTVCGAKFEAASHSWDSGKITTKATCVKKGVMTYTCTVCGATKTKELAMTEHSWDGGKTTKEPTVTEKGESTFKCIVCGKVATREIAPLGLSMSPEELTTLVAVSGNIMGAKLSDATWAVMQAVLDETELERIRGGWPVTITLCAEDAAGDVGAQEQSMLTEAAEESEVFAFFRLSLTKQMQDDAAAEVETATGPVIISLTPPENLPTHKKAVDREFTVYMIRDGRVEKMPTQFDKETGEILFQTEEFGTFAVAYQDTKANIGGVLLIVLYSLLGLGTLCGIAFLIKKLFFGRDAEEAYYDDTSAEYDPAATQFFEPYSAASSERYGRETTQVYTQEYEACDESYDEACDEEYDVEDDSFFERVADGLADVNDRLQQRFRRRSRRRSRRGRRNYDE